MKKELTAVKNKIQKLKDKKALIDEELEPLFIREEELENVLKDARYRVIKKSGFAASTQYAKDQRKRDLYVLAAGACVTQMYEGDVYDVGTGEAHPVYRYAKPIFMEV